MATDNAPVTIATQRPWVEGGAGISEAPQWMR